MVDKLEKSKQRHQDENADEPEQKRSKPNECEGAANTVETKTITNIYYDCLERIFDFLDLESSLMVAQTCKRLQIAAAAKFGDEFGKERIHLYLIESIPIVLQNEIRVFGLKLCLAFLRCFGAKISDLCIGFHRIHPKKGHLDQYLNQYCADTLTAIEFYINSPTYNWQFSNEAFKKPFKYVEKVKISGGNWSDQLSNFVNWFPNFRQLKMFYCLVDETTPMNWSFSHLEHLDLHIDPPRTFCIEQAANLLQANPQLHSVKLRLGYKLTLNALLNTIIANSLIMKLEVAAILSSLIANVSEEELNRFVVEHSLVEELVLEDHRLTPVDAIQFIRQMKSLKRVEFLVKDRSECDRITQEFNNEWKSKVLTTEYDEYDEYKIELNR